MRNFFVYGGRDCRDYGVYISGQGTYNAPVKSYDRITVPGRSGDLLINNKRFDNVDLKYPAFIYDRFPVAIAKFKEALLSLDGYQRLEDSYNPEEYRRALYAGEMNVEANRNNTAGEFEILFSCDPRRFLKSGEIPQTIASGGHLDNPTLFSAQPLIKVTGYGELIVGEYVTTISNHFPYVYIDCSMMDCYHESDNANQYLTINGNEFPVLKAGRTGVTYSGHITKVEITPNWWRV